MSHREPLDLFAAIRILTRTHTRRNDEVDYIVMHGASPHPSDEPRYVEAWGVLRAALDMPNRSRSRLIDICIAVGKNLEGLTAEEIAQRLYTIASTGALAEFSHAPLLAEPHEVAEVIAQAIEPKWRTYKPDGPVRTKGQALSWAASVARELYPKPKETK